MEDKILTIDEVAELAGKSRPWVYRQIDKNQIPFFCVPRKERCSVFRFKSSLVNKYLKNSSKNKLTENQWHDIAKAIKK